MAARAWRSERWLPLFFTIWGGQVFSLLGSRIVQFALVWWLTKTTGSAVVLTTATIAALIPGVALGPFIGPLIDRWNRRHVMIVADSLIALATALLAALFALGIAEAWHIYVIMFARSVGGAFHWPAMQASTTLMVPGKHYSRIAGLNQSLQGAASLVGPAIGALLIEILPMQGVLAVDVLTAAIAVLPLLFIAIPQPKSVARAMPSFRQDFVEGFRFLTAWPGLIGVALIASFLNFLLAPAGSLIPLLVTKHFGGGAYHLAGLQMASGVGVIAGGLILTAWGGFKRRMATAMFGVIFLGVGAIVLGLAPASLFALAIFAVLLTGLMQPIANGSIMAALQASTPPDMQGRLFSLLGSAAGAMMPLGLFLAGQLADRLGAGAWYIVGGAACILLGGLGLTIPAIVNLEERGEELAAARELLNGSTPPQDSAEATEPLRPA
jgi:DHA3 family macrolide efflux protein-like MFS transporter